MKYRMLLVEDDDRIREIVEDYFSAHKNIPGARNLGEEDEITVISAKDGDEGLVRIAEGGDMKMGKHRKKKVSFGRIWIAIALPVVALTIIALAIMSELLLTALFIQEEPLASEVAYETALRLKERELSSPKGCSDILNLEKSQMVAVLYDEQGNRLVSRI